MISLAQRCCLIECDQQKLKKNPFSRKDGFTFVHAAEQEIMSPTDFKNVCF